MTPRILIEGCAGLASLSLAAVCGRPTDAPWSRPGSKTGYARSILRLAGLTRWRPEEIVWAEPTADCRMMLHAYPNAERLHLAAALCREWGTAAGEEGQRELWARLKAEGPPGQYTAREVARVAAVQARTVSQAGVGDFGGKSKGSWMPRNKSSDGTGLYPNEAPAAKLEAIAGARWPPTRLYRDVREIEPVEDAFFYADWPYFGTLTYGPDDITRPDALEVMRRWSAAGSLVLASEAVPLAEELGPGWWAVDIGSARAGKARSGANRGCVTEWVTMNRPPAWRPGVQAGLFGGTR
jgi:hypothetical protein